tara:strand:- start:466 stop:678 length:213 start_codon:yes stop_codon:yes gene_type:complete
MYCCATRTRSAFLLFEYHVINSFNETPSETDIKIDSGIYLNLNETKKGLFKRTYKNLRIKDVPKKVKNRK